MEKLENKDSCIMSFSSINELVDIAEKSDKVSQIINAKKWVYSENIECDTREKSFALLRSGRGLSSIRKLSRKYRQELENSDLSEIIHTTKSIKRTRRFNDFDGNLDFDRVMVGNPDYWEKIKRDGDAKIVRIGINYALANTNTIHSFSRIVGLSAIFAEILENLGYGVEIYGSSFYENDRKKPRTMRKQWLGCLFPVKLANEPLDFDRIYSLGLPALLRDAEFHVEHHFYNEFGGFAYSPSPELLSLTNIDVLVTKSWTNGKESEKIMQAIEKL